MLVVHLNFILDWAHFMTTNLYLHEKEQRVPLESPLQVQEAMANRKRFPQQYVTDWIRQHVTHFPNKIAVTDGHTQLSYRELDIQSDHFAAKLQFWIEENPIQAHSSLRFGVCFQPSINEILVILAIIKVGGCYVPLNPEVPKARQTVIIKDSQCQAIITENQSLSMFIDHPVILIDALQAKNTAMSMAPKVTPSANQPLHIMYTSGSTGTPKGILTSHGNMNNIIYGLSEAFQIKNRQLVFCITRSIFDPYIADLFLTFLHGLTFYCVNASLRASPRALAKLINQHKPDYLCTTPTIWRELIKYIVPFDHSPYLITNGEALDPMLAKDLCQRSSNCWNLYGPTETTLWASYTRINNGQNHIGKPFANYEFYILDKQGHLVTPGETGELYIGGPSLAKYCSPSINNDNYFHCFAKSPSILNQTLLYKTGDLAKQDADGDYHWLGRVDLQFKKSGQRIEPGDIEYQLRLQSCISTAAIICLLDAPHQPIIAFCQLTSIYHALIKVNFIKKHLDNRIKKNLKSALPHHMIPNEYIYLKSIPKTASGKIDRQSLKNMYQTAATKTMVQEKPFQLGLEEYRLYALWQTLMPITKMDYDADFFQSGGTSLLAAQYITKLNSAFDLNLPIAWVYQYPTIAGQAHYLRNITPQTLMYVPILKLNHAPAKAEPLYLIHPMLSGAESYYHLASKIKHFQVYGVEHYNLYHTHTIDNFDALVAHYVKVITTHQSSRKISLGGWSFGGMLALEISNKLQTLGYDISQVILIDPLLLHSFAYRFLSFCLRYSLTYISVDDRFKDYLANLPTKRRKQAMLATSIEFKMLASYQRKSYSMPVLLFYATQPWIYRIYEYPGQFWSWKKYLPHCQIIEIDSDHLNIIYLPTAETIAERI